MNKLAFSRENILIAAIFFVSAYLALFNLGHVTLWHDEALMGGTGKNIVETGGYNGWDGRNMLLTAEGASVNSNFKLVSYPPWQALPSALGIALFGANEFGVRFFHTVLGLLSLLVFWRLLRLEFPSHARLRVVAFALLALSTQALLFFRLGRYAADAIFFGLLLLYSYRLYVSAGGRWWHLAIATAAVVLGFLNHFAIGAAFAMALAAVHLIYEGRNTSRHQWMQIAVAGAVAAALCLLYLISAGIILSGETLEFSDVEYKYGWLKRKSTLTYYNFREMMWYGWVPLWVAVWLVYIFARPIYDALRKGKGQQKKKKKGKKTKSARQTKGGWFATLAPEHAVLLRLVVLMALFLLISALIAPRPVSVHVLADSRYLVPVLPIAVLICAAFVEWLWRFRWGVVVAPMAMAALLLSNLLSYPFIFRNYFTHEGLRWSLPALIKEVHSPYPTYIREVAGFLRENAAQDDTVYFLPWQDHAAFIFYLSDKLIFCCSLTENSALPKEKVRALGAPLYRGDALPVWFVSVGADVPAESQYELAFTSDQYSYPTQRPEFEFHVFGALPGNGAVRVFKRRDSGAGDGEGGSEVEGNGAAQ